MWRAVTYLEHGLALSDSLRNLCVDFQTILHHYQNFYILLQIQGGIFRQQTTNI